MLKSATNLIKQKQQFFKYCVGGGTAFVVDFSLLYIFTFIVGLHYLISNTIAFVAAAVVNYLIQKFWTFKCREKRIARQFFVFITVQIVGLFINNTTMYIMVDHFHLWIMLSKVIAAIIVLVWNFWASKKFVFNKEHLDKKYQVLVAGEIFPPDIGGPATYSYRVSKYLLDQGYDLRIVCYSNALPARTDEEFGDKIIRVSALRPLVIKYFLYFLRLLNIAIHAKVIYAQGPVASGLPAILVSRILRKQLVIKVVGDYAWEQARLFKATDKDIDDWQHNPEFNSSSKFINLKLKFINYIEKNIVKRADFIIVPSQYLKNMVRSWGVGSDNIKVIYNSVDYCQKINLAKEEAKDIVKIKGDILITVARLMNWKGLDTLIKIMPNLKKINSSFKLVILGDGPEEKKLRALVKEYNLADSVIMTGRIPRSKIGYYYAAASVFVLNSAYEGLSHVMLEAMNYHLPIIASDAGGNRELVQDGFNGILVGYNDRPEWINAIKDLWQDPSKRKRFSHNPMVKMDVFSFENMIKQTLKVLGVKNEK